MYILLPYIYYCTTINNIYKSSINIYIYICIGLGNDNIVNPIRNLRAGIVKAIGNVFYWSIIGLWICLSIALGEYLPLF